MRKPKNIFLRRLPFLFHAAGQSADKKVTASEVLQREMELMHRRKFLKKASAAASSLIIPSVITSCGRKHKTTDPEIAIVGGGMAGLHAALLLRDSGLKSTIYEASPRLGGRIFSVGGMLGENLVTEMGGEFIDSRHTDMMTLAARYNLPLLDRLAAGEEKLIEFAYYFGGEHRDEEEISEALRPFVHRIKSDIDSLSEEITFESYSPADAKLDQITLAQYLSELGISGWLYNLIDASYTAEYGMDITEQSALNFLLMFTPGANNSFQLYGESDERFSVIGGNQLLIDAMSGELKSQIRTEHFLQSISMNASGKFRLALKTGGNAVKEVNADIVILAIPFTLLRECEINLVLPEWKSNCINKVGYGTNSKIFIGLNERVWRAQGYGGYSFSDNGMMNGYDNTRMQNGNTGAGGFTVFLGGKAGLSCNQIPLTELQQKMIPACDEVFHGIKDSFNNNFQLWHWPSYVFSKCSYLSFSAGQYVTMNGAAAKPVGNLFFAGEHCSNEFQGYMNGAAESGRIAAEKIIQSVL